ncbi:MAG: hypothetical protein EBU46_09520 [Nitrosomonadaceae bacterium]|nr:hypothetical protein [Nitrosomonadaceae bacterium]
MMNNMTVGNYQERYCLFLDILGFKSHVNESINTTSSDSKAMSFSKLKAALSEISRGVNYRDGIAMQGKIVPTSRQVTQFSDSIVISYLKNEPYRSGVSSIILDVHRLQLELVKRGILLRGAITLGLLYHDDTFIFGPALNEAVALECLAGYPRVILDGKILEDAGFERSPGLSNPRAISSMVSLDFDGLYYVDYFNIHPDDFEQEWYYISDYLSKLRELIKNLSHKRDPSIKVKYSWLRAKFNAIADNLESKEFKELGTFRIPEDDQDFFRMIRSF